MASGTASACKLATLNRQRIAGSQYGDFPPYNIGPHKMQRNRWKPGF